MSAAFVQAFAKRPWQQIAYRVFTGGNDVGFHMEISVWIWQRVRNRSHGWGAAFGAECSPEAPSWTVYGAAQRDVLYLAAPCEPSHVDVSHPSFCDAQAIRRSSPEADPQRSVYGGPHTAQSVALGPGPDSNRTVGLCGWNDDHGRQWRSCHAG